MSDSTDVGDLSYDGQVHGDKIQGGLGRLVDGVHGEDNFKMDIGYGKGNIIIICYKHALINTVEGFRNVMNRFKL